MEWKEVEGNLFDYEKTHYLAQCISSDFKMSKGIATEFVNRYNLKELLLDKYKDILPNIWSDQYPLCDLTKFEDTKGVFNLITKKKFSNKPTYKTLTNSLEEMKKLVKELIDSSDEKIKIAMPKIGSGLDRLEWDKVKNIVLDVFKDVDVEILFVYYLGNE